MILHVTKYDIHPDKLEAYQKWTEGAIKRAVFGVPGVVEFRAYRSATGSSQIVLTYEFADLAAWAAWNSSAAMQELQGEVHTLALNVSNEVWGPSPVVPAPIRPGK
jgi:antibiotic biosynthesis monooxygenase (ABM) superfamily enzyme